MRAFLLLPTCLTIAYLTACAAEPSLNRPDQVDADSDGFFVGDDLDEDQVPDCDDTDPDINPEADEYCDGLDNNCDGQVDEVDPDIEEPVDDEGRVLFTVYYRDVDLDGFGDPNVEVRACDPPDGYVANSSDCDDDDVRINPGANDTCDGIDNDCDGQVDDDDDDAVIDRRWYPDDDEDGYGDDSGFVDACDGPAGYIEESGDCDDTDGSRNPDAVEVCDGIDNDCDSLVDDADSNLDTTTRTEFWVDADADGYGDPSLLMPACEASSGVVANDLDCNDDDETVSPDATEVCDGGVDNDCDGAADDLDADLDQSTTTTFYGDIDGDGDGNPLVSTQACLVPERFSVNSDDCDDGDASRNGSNEWYGDSDGDGHGGGSPEIQCLRPENAYRTNTDCDDDEPLVHNGRPEVCDGLDNDCNDLEDDGVLETYYLDDDGDGFGVTTSTLQTCAAPDGYADVPGDCDDDDAELNPGTIWYLDADNDDYGNDSSSVAQCSAPSSVYVLEGGDCAPNNQDISPGATEVCDGVDNNCVDGVDEGVTTDYWPDGDEDGFGDASADAVPACDQPDGHVADDSDCDDTSPHTYPGAMELCDGVLNDCVDEDWQSDAGLASWTVDNGESWADWTDTLGAGTSQQLAEVVTTEAGRLQVCDGTWYATLEPRADLELVGIGEAAVLSGAETDTPLTILTDGITVNVDGLILEDGSATYSTGAWPNSFPEESLIGGNLLCDAEATLSLTDVTLRGGTADRMANAGIVVCTLNMTRGLVADGAAAVIGAGLYVHQSQGTIEGTTFRGNDAGSLGGGLALGGTSAYSVTDAVFESNLSQFGAGAYLADGVATLTNVTFERNSAVQRGGAVMVEDGLRTPTATFVSNTFLENEAGVGGGALYVIAGTASVTVEDSRFEDNHSTGAGGAIFVQNGNLSVSGSLLKDNWSSANIGGVFLDSVFTHGEFVNTDFVGNQARNAAGGLGGGALALRQGASADISGCSFEQNRVEGPAADPLGGGAIWSWSNEFAPPPVLNIDSTSFTQNDSDARGGALWLVKTLATLQSVEFDDNFADQIGGAMYVAGGSVLEGTSVDVLSNSTSPSGAGGGLYVQQSTVSLLQSDLVDNSPNDTFEDTTRTGQTWGRNVSIVCNTTVGCVLQ